MLKIDFCRGQGPRTRTRTTRRGQSEAKDLTYEAKAKAKDFTIVLEAKAKARGLQHCISKGSILFELQLLQFS